MGYFAHLALILTSAVYLVKGQNTVTACERSTLAISCEADQVIQTVSSFYGRTDGGICTDGTILSTRCQTDTTDILQKQCNGKQSCTTEVTDMIFGDPCFGTLKYLSVTYICVPRTQIRGQACEGQSLDLTCPSGLTLDITYANWGRTDTTTCPSDTNINTTCQSDVIDLVKSLCQGQGRCTLAANDQTYGDPCSGTYKFLDVQFMCSGGKTVVCENGLDLITCPPGQILVIIDATYGRQDGTICTGCSGCPADTSCNSATAYSTISRMCDGKTACLISASNSVFGDPCPGTMKYATVSYYCTSA